MRFANIGFSFLILLTGEIFLPNASMGAPWQIFGRQALTIDLPDEQAAGRVNKFNQKLGQIVPKLNPDRNWDIDIKVNKIKVQNLLQVKSALIRLEGYNLIFITEADATAQGFGSASDLADSWARSLSETFKDPNLRKLLVLGMGMPPEVNYRGVNYYLKPTIAGDRGLFRTSGQPFMGRVVYWEVPADSKAYQITSTNKSLESNQPPTEVFLLNRKRQFLTYTQQRS